MAEVSVRLGVDIGETFTDVMVEKGGVPFSTKVLKAYVVLENAIFDGMHQVRAKVGAAPSQIYQSIHSTTLATNAIIERCSAKTALTATEGFRDADRAKV